ncbi:hypothetical protein ACLBV5_09755 [Brevundimonas sp. M1A4_2e]
MNCTDTRAIHVQGEVAEIFKMLGWLADNTRSYRVTVMTYEDERDAHITALVSFTDDNEALLFKMAWAGS